MELDHHRTIHLRSVHVIDTLHPDQVLLLTVLTLYVHHILVARILMLSLTIIQVLVDRNVLQVVLILLLAAESELGTLIKLVGVALAGDVHHNEVLTKLILIKVVHSHRVVVHLTVVLQSCYPRCILRI